MKSSSAFYREITTSFHKLKLNQPCRLSPIIPIQKDALIVGYLRIVSKVSLKDPREIRLLAAWRRKYARWFPSQFRVTFKGTRKWVQEQLLEKEDRILFMIEDLNKLPIGHIGLYRFNFDERFCEIDNVIRGRKYLPGIMTAALNTLCAWGFSELKLKSMYLRVFADNEKAVTFYRRGGFTKVEKIPLKKIVTKGAIVWKEIETDTEKAQRYFLQMRKIV